MDAYVGDGALYCEDCAATGDEGYADGGGEADGPQHCDGCGVFLENPLTPDGEEYVRELLGEHLATGRGDAEVLATWRDFYGIDWPRVSLTYGVLPDAGEIIRRVGPDGYPMLLRGECARAFDRVTLAPGTVRDGRRGGIIITADGVPVLLRALVGMFDAGDDAAGDLASAILETINVEWV